MYIRDVKSSNGTFINNERLSPEGMESEPFELKSEDMVVSLCHEPSSLWIPTSAHKLNYLPSQEFGIDIVNEDNRTIMHHKVAAKAYCVFGLEDAAGSARKAGIPSSVNRIDGLTGSSCIIRAKMDELSVGRPVRTARKVQVKATGKA